MAGRLMGLDAMQLANALALSGARSITPIVVRQGDISAAKSVANSLVAQNGMQATILAKHGLTGPLDLFENRNGLKSIFPGIAWMGPLAAPLPAASYIMGCHIKAFPCLATGQGIVAAGIDLHDKVNGDIDRLKHISVAIADTPQLQRQKDDPGRVDPQSREAADHSFNFLAAVAIVDGEFGLDSFDNERWNDAKVRAVMERLEIVCDGTLNARSPGAFPCSMRAKDAGGQEIVAESIDPPGFSRHGVDANAVIKKFNSNTHPWLDAAGRQRVIDAAMALDKSSSIDDLTKAIGQPRSV
jgi:2-methylcitrate dehydratase